MHVNNYEMNFKSLQPHQTPTQTKRAPKHLRVKNPNT